MVSPKAQAIILLLMVISLAKSVVSAAATECSTVTELALYCSSFITYGSPDPFPGSPCCDAMTSLNVIADSADNRRLICRCMMGLISTYNPNATAIATLSGSCGVSLGFTIDPNTDCSLVSNAGFLHEQCSIP